MAIEEIISLNLLYVQEGFKFRIVAFMGMYSVGRVWKVPGLPGFLGEGAFGQVLPVRARVVLQVLGSSFGLSFNVHPKPFCPKPLYTLTH